MDKQFTVLGIVMMLLLVGCAETQQAPEEETVKSVTVETKKVQPQLFERHLKLVGSVEAQNDVRISAEVSGRVEQYYVEQGDAVSKGTPLLKIDDSKLQREKARLQAQTQQTKEQYERLSRVFEQDSIGSEIDVINAKTAYEQSRAALESVEVDLQNTTVRAPFDATVEDIMMEEGEMASPGAMLVRLIGNNRLKVSAGVPSNYSNVVNRGDSAEVWFDYQQADTLKLPISFVGKSINPEDRTFEIEVNLPAGGEDYKVDMVSNIKVQTLRQENAVVIGKEFLYQNGEQNVVYVVSEDSSGHTVAQVKPVQLGASYQNKVVIADGLGSGEQLITIGSSFLQDAMRIEVVEEKKKNLVQENS
ncbi:efflux RND transporter periplasmic adaptor subunit [Fodinibius salsisoli]|uniref:Efflux RND transporter periplasmic adaptor subunit n=1 Tax=Fodinibius salsisoli TaxID=2820877 RepID=A0ABT3PHE5_9BACT|nr:efflux RND transporter periplasmic adaptor subunit [Fodinibius salsisoli]MCW9705332.1 efflux RND transporter periplasmic adaptor subunit [Fodinibius salsisoli]